MQYRQVLTASGSWQCPEGVTEVAAECTGGGAGGRNTGTANFGAAGGGGGAWASRLSVPVTPGEYYDFTVGAAVGPQTNGNDTIFTGDDSVQVKAVGGKGFPNGRAGGAAADCIGDDGYKYSGGDGGADYNQAAGDGGGGGASANPGGNGNNGTDGRYSGGPPPPGGAGALGGGDGGDGGVYYNGTAAEAGFAPGGGGGGCGGFGDYGGRVAGGGARGQIILTWTFTLPFAASQTEIFVPTIHHTKVILPLAGRARAFDLFKPYAGYIQPPFRTGYIDDFMRSEEPLSDEDRWVQLYQYGTEDYTQCGIYPWGLGDGTLHDFLGTSGSGFSIRKTEPGELDNCELWTQLLGVFTYINSASLLLRAPDFDLRFYEFRFSDLGDGASCQIWIWEGDDSPTMLTSGNYYLESGSANMLIGARAIGDQLEAYVRSDYWPIDPDAYPWHPIASIEDDTYPVGHVGWGTRGITVEGILGGWIGGGQPTKSWATLI